MYQVNRSDNNLMSYQFNFTHISFKNIGVVLRKITAIHSTKKYTGKCFSTF